MVFKIISFFGEGGFFLVVKSVITIIVSFDRALLAAGNKLNVGLSPFLVTDCKQIIHSKHSFRTLEIELGLGT